MNIGNTELPTMIAAAYVRMSTEHRQFSISKQMRAIRKFARWRGLEIVKEYSDAGQNRVEAMKQIRRQAA